MLTLRLKSGHWSGGCIPDADLRGGGSFIPDRLDPASTVTAGLLDLAGTNDAGLAVVGVVRGHLGLLSELRVCTG
ncbi:hypothetical protein GOODEAATRI_030183 [Goodea atripinnis]|uniref:Uncharacterized protein n=1 Tax=Goodea atripinnis TaxID=208336 RepID=A0ABV0P2E7_9TELE